MRNNSSQGVLFNIQRSSIHDGPGVRTVLFFKGCPLRCVWCQNPESQKLEIEYAVLADHDGQSTKTKIGSLYSPKQAFIEIEKDLVFFESTNGGVTFSGGEPTFQLGFLKQLVGFCKSKGIHMVLETCGYFQYDAAIQILKDIDLIYFDIKVADPRIHKDYTSKSNMRILMNLKQLYSEHPNLLVRYVSVPELNSKENHLNHFAQLLKKLDIQDVSILKYNSLWVSKTRNVAEYETFIKEYSFREIESCWTNTIQIMEQKGFRVVNTG